MDDGTPPAGRGLIERYRQIANEAAEFAKSGAVASRLPGAFGGPQDAYRHIIASAELTRRIGLPGIAIMEANEANSWWADLMDRIAGRQRQASNRPDARAMDARTTTSARQSG